MPASALDYLSPLLTIRTIPTGHFLPAGHARKGPGGVIYLWRPSREGLVAPMLREPEIKRTVAFFDGQNLFHAAKSAFGYTYPNYDPAKLAEAVCKIQGWRLEQSRFYTGFPKAEDSELWNSFWNRKSLNMRRPGIHVYSRPLRYRYKTGPAGSSLLVAEEKGIDVRIALDVLSCVIRNECDVALIFSHQDLSEVADEIRALADRESRWLKV